MLNPTAVIDPSLATAARSWPPIFIGVPRQGGTGRTGPIEYCYPVGRIPAVQEHGLNDLLRYFSLVWAKQITYYKKLELMSNKQERG
jgi:hypothetical protein